MTNSNYTTFTNYSYNGNCGTTWLTLWTLALIIASILLNIVRLVVQTFAQKQWLSTVVCNAVCRNRCHVPLAVKSNQVRYYDEYCLVVLFCFCLTAACG